MVSVQRQKCGYKSCFGICWQGNICSYCGISYLVCLELVNHLARWCCILHDFLLCNELEVIEDAKNCHSQN